MSLAQFIIVGNWLMERNFVEKFSKFKKARYAHIIMSLYIIHLLGLLYTTDFNYALNDLRIKLPILIFPFLISTSNTLSRKKVNIILLTVGIFTFISTLISISIYMGITGKEILDTRQISPLISHIRLALLVCLSIGISVWFYFTPPEIKVIQKHLKSFKVALIIAVLWFLLFLFILESLTGIFIISSAIIIGSIATFIKSSLKKYRLVSALALLGIVVFSVFIEQAYIKPLIKKNKVDWASIPKVTANGRAYDSFDPQVKFTENGFYNNLYLCTFELEMAWDERARIKYDSLDSKSQILGYTLQRYLTSKGLTKDSVGVSKLTDNDIRLIEKGITNYKIPEMNPLQKRAYQVYCEYQSFKYGLNASGHSLVMRLHYWHAALLIIKDHWLTGVGTGDLEQSFQDKYNEIDSSLNLQYRHRAHNQYLTMAIAFGVFGFIYFIYWLFWPMLKRIKNIHPVYYIFLFIFLLSMLFEDTLETQAGLSFSIFFTCIFLLSEHKNRNTEKEEKNSN